MRGALVLALVGCGFHTNAAPDARSDDGAVPDAPEDAMPDEMEPPPSAYCSVDGVVACYEFEGNTSDGSGHKLHASTTNVLFVTGKVGQAGSFVAASQAKTAASPMFNVEQLTIEAWVRLPAPPTIGSQANIVAVDQQYTFFINSDGTVTCDLVGVQAIHTMGIVLNNVWTHVACTYNGNVGVVYLDGRSAKSEAIQDDLATGGHDLALGGNGRSGAPLTGLIDQVRLMRVARSADDICLDAGAACPP